MRHLDEVEIDIPCPKCQTKTRKSIEWINGHREYVCAGCQTVINLNADQFRNEIRKAERALGDFKRKVRRLGC